MKNLHQLVLPTLKSVYAFFNCPKGGFGSAKYGLNSSRVKRLAASSFFVGLLIVLSGWTHAADSNRLVIAAEAGKGLAIASVTGEILWKRPLGAVHDVQLLPNHRLLVNDGWTRVTEINLQKEIVWTYDSAVENGNAGKKLEIHSFQRLANGHTLIAESGVCRLIEVDAEKKLVHEMKLQVAKPHPHTDTRLVRALPNGDYLVCHEGEERVVRYAPDGKILWEFPVPLFGKPRAGGHGPEAFGGKCFGAIVLKNGNYLIATGNGHSVLEVTPAKEIVWKVEQKDLPGITLAWVTTVQELPNGNIVIGNCHAGPENPQIVEITKEKSVVWTWKNFTDFGNGLANTWVVEGEAADSLRAALPK